MIIFDNDSEIRMAQKKPFVLRLDPEVLKAIENGPQMNFVARMGKWSGLLPRH